MKVEPLSRKASLGAELTRRLQDMILGSDLEPGQRLPGQRELAGQFGVSMAAVREALSALAAAGLVESRQGQGTFVRGIGESPASMDGWLGPTPGPDELQEYLEVRRELERFAVCQACRRATPAQKERLLALVWDMTETAGGASPASRGQATDLERYSQADLALHMTIAEAAGNRVLLRMMRALQASLQRYLARVNEEHYSRGSLGEALQNHQRLVAAICEGREETAGTELANMIERGARYWEEPSGGTK